MTVEEIIEALPHDFVRRMRNWARSCDGGPVSTSKLEERVDHWRHEHPIPMLMGEADDTHAAVLKLPQRFQECVVVFWRYQARPIKWMVTATPKMRRFQLGPTSFAEWLAIGHERLQVEIGKQTERQAKRSEASATVQAK